MRDDHLPFIEDESSEWRELFQEEKTDRYWQVCWESHLIEEITKPRRRPTIYEKFSEWEALPYRIMDPTEVSDLIHENTILLAK